MASPAQTEQRLQVKVFSPYDSFFEGTALSLSANNAAGSFDVLYNHANFFSLLVPGRVTVNTGYNTVMIDIESGVLHVRDNNITLYANV